MKLSIQVKTSNEQKQVKQNGQDLTESMSRKKKVI